MVSGDLGGGVYVSRVDSDDFEADAEAGGFTHLLFEDGPAMAGLWKSGADPTIGTTDYEIPARQTIVVLAGAVRIEILGGPTLDLTVGDMASMPKGALTRWHPSPDFKEVWVYSA
jgi:uncharacterized cupin superfamily protein